MPDILDHEDVPQPGHPSTKLQGSYEPDSVEGMDRMEATKRAYQAGQYKRDAQGNQSYSPSSVRVRPAKEPF